jgi:hypothetical protein
MASVRPDGPGQVPAVDGQVGQHLEQRTLPPGRHPAARCARWRPWPRPRRRPGPASSAPDRHTCFGSSPRRSPSRLEPTSAMVRPARSGGIHAFSDTRWFTRARTSHSVQGVGSCHWPSAMASTFAPNCSYFALRYSSWTSAHRSPLSCQPTTECVRGGDGGRPASPDRRGAGRIGRVRRSLRPLLGPVLVAALVSRPPRRRPPPATAVHRSGISGGAGFEHLLGPRACRTCRPGIASPPIATWASTSGVRTGRAPRRTSRRPGSTTWWPTGYGLIPIWVGLQAPCSTLNVDKMSQDPITAHAQGKTAADDATAAAQALGLQRGSIVYDVMESYGATPGPCEDAGGRLRRRLGGSAEDRWLLLGWWYGSTCGSGVSDWASSAHVPSDVWGANWIGKTRCGTCPAWTTPCGTDGARPSRAPVQTEA